ncbi:hypothetical protein ACIQZM_18500 [Peribacillus sp. NPDC097206]|uniref:hypothetical protein n=1 Tax=Peribacillus sp. NPDC097206 TaxID=3364398 RepID=UPI003814CEC6
MELSEYKELSLEQELNRFMDKYNLSYPKIRKKNEVKIEGQTALIYVNSEQHKNEYFITDTKFLPIVKKFVWHFVDGYAVATIHGYKAKKYIKMHRLIMGVLNKAEVEIDHINGDKSDNRNCNLRACVKGKDVDNQANLKLHFEFPEIVDNWKMNSTNHYIMEVSDGKYEKVRIPYQSFGDLLNDKRLLYEIGMDEGLPEVLYRKQIELYDCLNSYKNDTKEYKVCLYYFNHIYKKVDEAKERVKDWLAFLIENGIKKDDIKLDRPYTINGVGVVIPSGKSSKEKFHSKTSMRIESNIYRDVSLLEDELLGELDAIES